MQDEDLVGSVHESDAVHWMRHGEDPSSSTCGRCLYIRNKAEFYLDYRWLQPRPLFMGGNWRLGCNVCSWRSKNSEREKHEGKRGCKVRASTFAAFNFVCHESARRLRIKVQAHSLEEGHRIAVLASNRASRELPACTAIDSHDRPLAVDIVEAKTKALIAEASTTILDDNRVLKGSVPQCDDWLSAWAESTEQISFRKQDRLSAKRNRKHSRLELNLRRIRRKQVRVMAETHREVLRKRIGEAQFIFLSMDDRQYQKVVRFRCDAPREPYVHSGILGVMGLEKSDVGDFEEDHALIGVRKLDSFLNTFCTPLHSTGRPSATDLVLKEHIKKCTRVFAADGGSKERRALLLATERLFPNVAFLLRDAAHALRIAIKNPLHFDDLFGEVWTPCVR